MKRTALLLLVMVGAMFVYTPLWGQEYGAVLDDSERQAMSETFQYALENNRTNEASEWVNPDTERSGSVVPVNTYQNSAGLYCREFVTTVTIGGVEEPAYGTACRQPDGAWLIVPGEAAAESERIVERVIEKHYIHPYGYGDWYAYHPFYYYPDPWFYSSRIFFSFNIVHFSGTRHFKHARVHHPHFHGIHRHKVKDLRFKHHDGIIRSHRGGVVVRPGGGHIRRDFRRGLDDRVIRGSGAKGGRQHFHRRDDAFRNSDRRGIHRGGGGRDFHNRRDFRQGADDRVIRRPGTKSGRQHFHRRDSTFRNADRRGTHRGGGGHGFDTRHSGYRRSGR